MATSTSLGRLPRRPNLPDLPPTLNGVISYLPKLDRAVSDFYDDISSLLNAHVPLTNRATFGAADTVIAVVFTSPLEDVGYQVFMTPTWNATLFYSAKTVNGFTINASAAPGGGGGTVDWTINR